MTTLLMLLSMALVAFQTPSQTQPTVLGSQNVLLTVKLLSPISTVTSNNDDKFTALVEAPPAYEGAILQGKITSVKKPKKGVAKGKPEIAFQFESITFNEKTAAITADLKEVVNSKGVKGVDEEGQVIGTT